MKDADDPLRVQPPHRQGILTAPPPDAPPPGKGGGGTRPLGLGRDRDGLILLPERPEGPVPLLVMLHGAGAAAGDVLPMVAEEAEQHGVAVLAPDARGGTWDMLRRGYGPDVAFIDAALRKVRALIAVEPRRMAIAGFSDGGSYALSLGLTNGRMFSDIIAFSPGFAAPTRTEDAPRIFVSHGREDPVLPIDRCGRRVATLLRAGGYDLAYHEFSGGHVVPADIVHAALERFLAGGA